MNPAELLAAMRRTVEQLAASNEIAKALTSTLELREVLSLVMQKVRELLKPRNWSLLLYDERTGRLYFEIAVGEGAEALKRLQVAPGEGIAGAVFASGRAQRVDDVSGEPGFSRRFDAASAFHTRSLLAVPLVARGRVLGVIELVNGEGDAPFSDGDLQVLTAIADYAAIALENARNFRRVQELTLTDEHTGISNARHLRAQLEQEVLRSLRFHHPLSLVFLDLDRFKAVNDTHGHLAGSAALREVGEVLVSCARQVDVVCRYGGDEFALLLVETGLDGAQPIAERVRDALRERRFLAQQGLDVRLTASLGVATFPEHAQDALGLLKAADQAMYAAKARGRDDVCIAPPLPTPLASGG
ncbi:sensor domain-containing diguanylate cyclase [Aggregicoccus sp. 17bor-14]|uniref:GGDEF domain-containing protein n=1 Tax=Myxococcaceae TaxID=31 RepID=UPI00129CFB73|nr:MULTISPECIES: sensor domain-containing diguanylate cyclase [Myxococcaceae]MBF5041449.1 sensor domain-containing diguanylate cyclase [Simulacricoccus sp. 17bor-14]MRI87233.1 sensor domain-containing diguanylate cyclase [Aggregicoccus sp. 17bor-14]